MVVVVVAPEAAEVCSTTIWVPLPTLVDEVLKSGPLTENSLSPPETDTEARPVTPVTTMAFDFIMVLAVTPHWVVKVVAVTVLVLLVLVLVLVKVDVDELWELAVVLGNQSTPLQPATAAAAATRDMARRWKFFFTGAPKRSNRLR